MRDPGRWIRQGGNSGIKHDRHVASQQQTSTARHCLLNAVELFHRITVQQQVPRIVSRDAESESIMASEWSQTTQSRALKRAADQVCGRLLELGNGVTPIVEQPSPSCFHLFFGS